MVVSTHPFHRCHGGTRALGMSSHCEILCGRRDHATGQCFLVQAAAPPSLTGTTALLPSAAAPETKQDWISMRLVKIWPCFWRWKLRLFSHSGDLLEGLACLTPFTNQWVVELVLTGPGLGKINFLPFAKLAFCLLGRAFLASNSSNLGSLRKF